MTASMKVMFLGDAKSAKKAAREAGAAVDKFSRDADNSTSKVGKLGASFDDALKRYGPLAAAAGGAALLKFGLDSVKAASEVQQSFGALDSVFGENSATVKKWATDAANNLGLAKSEYASLAAVLGSMLKNSGIEDFAGETDRLIKLGGDLAATFGGTTKEAVEAIGSLLRGETDPIEKYGVSIKQADISARLAAEGLGKLEGSAKTQAEQQARLALLFEKTSDAQGQFSRESDTLSQAQQKLGANWENLQATLGEKFLPIASKVVQWLSDTVSGSNATSDVLQRIGGLYQDYLTPIIDAASDAWDRISDAVNDATGRSDGMSFVLDKIFTAAEKVVPILGALAGAGIGQLTTAIVFGIGFFNAMATALDWIGDRAKWVSDKLGDVKNALSKINDSKLGQILSLGGGAGFLGLFREDQSWAGLGRAEVGLMFAGGGSPRVSVSAPQVVVLLDGRQIAAEYRVVARAEARREVSKQVLQARRSG